MRSAEKLAVLMGRRKEELARLIRVYYEERGWSASGVPTRDTLEQLGSWKHINEAARERIVGLTR